MILKLLLLLPIVGAATASWNQPASTLSGPGTFRDHNIPASSNDDVEAKTSSSESEHSFMRSRKAVEQVERSKIGQRSFCSTYDPTEEERLLMALTHQQWRSRHKGRKLQETNIEIPVYIHMLLAQDSPRLTNEQTKRYVNVLNRGFKGSPFKFALHGLDTTYNNTYARCQEEASFKKETRTRVEFDGPDVLHLWICDTNADAPGSVGYTYFPPIVQSSSSFLDGVGKFK